MLTNGTPPIPAGLLAAAALFAAASCSGESAEEDARTDPDATPPDLQADNPAGEPDGEAPDEAQGDPDAADAQEEAACPAFGDVQPIFSGSCGRCHPGYTTYEGIKANLSGIRVMVQMGHYVSGSDQALVLAWIDCGAPP